MTTQQPRPQPSESGYRGALPPQDDTLARPWVLTVIAIFVLILVLSVLGVPSRFMPEATPTPVPSITESAEPSGSADASGEPSAEPSSSAEASESPSTEPTESAAPSASAEPSG